MERTIGDSSERTLGAEVPATFDSYWHISEFERYDPIATATASTSPAAGLVAAADRVHSLVVGPRSPRVPLPAGDARRLDADAGFTGAAATSSWPRRDRARRSSPPSTTAGCPSSSASTLTPLRRPPPGDPRAVAAHVPGGADRRDSANCRSGRPAGAVAPRVRQRPVVTAYGVTDIPADHSTSWSIDEFHHAQATYDRRLLDLRPRALVGLTATPERADGGDIRAFRRATAAELRVWDALGADLLCPFHYFGVPTAPICARSSGPGMLRRRTARQRLTPAMTPALPRAESAADKVADVEPMRALGFCVSVAHAENMARVSSTQGSRRGRSAVTLQIRTSRCVV